MEEFNQKLSQIIEWVYREERTLIDKLTDKEYAEAGISLHTPLSGNHSGQRVLMLSSEVKLLLK